MEKDLLLMEYSKAGNKTKTGKLTVACKDEALKGVQWVYYLKGVF